MNYLRFCTLSLLALAIPTQAASAQVDVTSIDIHAGSVLNDDTCFGAFPGYRLEIDVEATGLASASVMMPSGTIEILTPTGDHWEFSSFCQSKLAFIDSNPSIGFGDFDFTLVPTVGVTQTVTLTFTPGVAPWPNPFTGFPDVAISAGTPAPSLAWNCSTAACGSDGWLVEAEDAMGNFLDAAALPIATTSWSPSGASMAGDYTFSVTTIEYFNSSPAALMLSPDGDSFTYNAYFSAENVLDTNLGASLSSATPEVDIANGGEHLMFLHGGIANANSFYWMFGSVTGTSPGLDFGGGVVLPLNIDAYFNLTLKSPNLFIFTDYLGQLDANGVATASFSLPGEGDPALAGLVLYHAYLSAAVFGFPDFASNAVSVTLTFD